MKQITAAKIHQGKSLTGVYRFLGKKVYIRNSLQAMEMTETFKYMGWGVKMGEGWIELDISQIQKEIKWKGEIFDPTLEKDEKIEKYLFDFFSEKLNEAGFTLEVKEI